MSRIAHLSDLHLLETGYRSRSVGERVRVGFLASYRPLGPEARIERLRRTLEGVRRAGPDHVLVTGDLTEDGTVEQWELLATLLHDSGLDPSRVTLLPGNHDAYGGAETFDEALRGPLAAFADSSRLGEPLELRDVTLFPLSTTIEQHYVRAAGDVPPHVLARLDALASDDRTVLVAQHHPPMKHARPGLHWFQGLVSHREMTRLLFDRPSLHVAHGHVHADHERSVHPERAPQVFSTRAVVQHDEAVRYYDADASGVRPSR